MPILIIRYDEVTKMANINDPLLIKRLEANIQTKRLKSSGVLCEANKSINTTDYHTSSLIVFLTDHFTDLL